MAIHLGGVTPVLFVSCPRAYTSWLGSSPLLCSSVDFLGQMQLLFHVAILYSGTCVTKPPPHINFYSKAAWNFSQVASSWPSVIVPGSELKDFPEAGGPHFSFQLSFQIQAVVEKALPVIGKICIMYVVVDNRRLILNSSLLNLLGGGKTVGNKPLRCFMAVPYSFSLEQQK